MKPRGWGSTAVSLPRVDDRTLAGYLAYGPPLDTEQCAALDAIGEDLLCADDDASALLVGGLLLRIARLETDLAGRAA